MAGQKRRRKRKPLPRRNFYSIYLQYYNSQFVPNNSCFNFGKILPFEFNGLLQTTEQIAKSPEEKNRPKGLDLR